MKKLYLLSVLLLSSSLLFAMEQMDVNINKEMSIQALFQELPEDLKLEIVKLTAYTGTEKDITYADLLSKINQFVRLQLNKAWLNRIQNDEKLNNNFIQFLKTRYANLINYKVKGFNIEEKVNLDLFFNLLLGTKIAVEKVNKIENLKPEINDLLEGLATRSEISGEDFETIINRILTTILKLNIDINTLDTVGLSAILMKADKNIANAYLARLNPENKAFVEMML